MKRFNIHINFKNGDELNANVVARNQADAMRRLEQTPEYIEFAGNTSIKDMSITPIPIASIDNERFAVTTIKNKPGWYVVADLDNLLKVEFKKGKYNETNTVSFIGNGKELSPLQQATALREIGEFMFNNFKDLI
jgi:hypothetical protein